MTALQETDVSEYVIPLENSEGLVTEGIIPMIHTVCYCWIYAFCIT